MKELRIPGRATKQLKGSLTVDADTAAVFRKVAFAEGRSRNLTSLLDDMIKAYVAEKHPDWKLVNEKKGK